MGMEVGTIDFWTDGWHDRTMTGFDRALGRDARSRVAEGQSVEVVADMMGLKPGYVRWVLSQDLERDYPDPE